VERLLKIGEFAERIGSTKKGVYSKIARRQIVPVRLGRSVRFPESYVAKLAKKGHGPSQKDPGGRPRVKVSLAELNRLRAQGVSWRRIGQRLGIGASTAFHLWQDGITPKAREKPVQKLRGDDSGG